MLICHKRNAIKLNSELKRIVYLLLYLNNLKLKKFILRVFFLFILLYLFSTLNFLNVFMFTKELQNFINSVELMTFIIVYDSILWLCITIGSI